MAEFDDKYIDPSKRLECRYYEPQYPEIEELVMVNVRNIAEMGAYVTLLEYNNIEGMILLSELSRRRIRSINKLIRVNRNEVVMVLRVDKKNGYIDLSKRRVSPEDVRAPTRETRLAGTRLARRARARAARRPRRAPVAAGFARRLARSRSLSRALSRARALRVSRGVSRLGRSPSARTGTTRPRRCTA